MNDIRHPAAQGAADVPADDARKLKILILSQYFWPEGFRVNDLTSELIARGHEVTVLTGLPNYPDGEVFADYRDHPEKYASFEGAPVHRVPVIPRGNSSLKLMLNYLSFALSGTIFGPGKLRGQRFDAIFVFQTSPITSALPALWIGWRKRAPVLMWVLDLWPDTLSAIGVVKSPALLGLVGKLVSFIYKRCARILVQSRAFYDNVERYAGGTDTIRYFPGWPEPVFQNAVDGLAPPPELSPYADDFKVMFAGNLGQAQDIPGIIEAADVLRDEPGLRWIIVGDGRAGEDARAEVARRGLGDKVIFAGRHPLERMPSFFSAADALLVTLRDEPIWSMTIPGKVQSYLASGRPLLGMFNGEGGRVIREAEAGMTAPAGDYRTLADNVRTMMHMSREERAELGRNGRAYAQAHFNRAALIASLEEWIVELGDKTTAERQHA
ncbi:glycosyltransferase family 4 protein [Citromicrobium sp. WPS32]|uniref:glycosyltransferase family 4 protein n=1 Tax=Citromicrobium sp. WPS32 TaxID=1634517 RepID=UPI0009EBE2F8|nr:glycosyltransferase family 4 protein [Citromicrobium sp. WPS32]|tara:strand:- start:1832 stop:3148 length:1317 start_codon:yes stop_codon:yes gene_type:complete